MREAHFKTGCECGKFCIEISSYPDGTPGRLKCYCDDCQTFLYYIQRSDLLDEHGGSEIIPFFPSDVRILSGVDHLQCIRLMPYGMFRFYTSCCNMPVANTDPKRAWMGFHKKFLSGKNSEKIDQDLGSIKASIMGKYAIGSIPKDVPKKINLKGIMAVMPFMIKGFLGKKAKPSPFFLKDNKVPIVNPYILTTEQLRRAKESAGFAS